MKHPEVAAESETWASLGGERESRARWEHMSSRSRRRQWAPVPHAGQGPGDWRQRWSWSRVGVRGLRWEGQIDCRRVRWQGLVGSPLHEASRAAGSLGGLEAGATLSGRSRGDGRARVMHWGGEAEIIRRRSSARSRQEKQQHSALFWGAGVEGIKMARTDLCLHREPWVQRLACSRRRASRRQPGGGWRGPPYREPRCQALHALQQLGTPRASRWSRRLRELAAPDTRHPPTHCFASAACHPWRPLLKSALLTCDRRFCANISSIHLNHLVRTIMRRLRG